MCFIVTFCTLVSDQFSKLQFFCPYFMGCKTDAFTANYFVCCLHFSLMPFTPSIGHFFCHKRACKVADDQNATCWKFVETLILIKYHSLIEKLYLEFGSMHCEKLMLDVCLVPTRGRMNYVCKHGYHP